MAPAYGYIVRNPGYQRTALDLLDRFRLLDVESILKCISAILEMAGFESWLWNGCFYHFFEIYLEKYLAIISLKNEDICLTGKKMEKHLGPEVASSPRKNSMESGDLLSESCDDQTRENTEGAQEGTAVCGD
ncbi:hypothetical protein CDAR_582671 [Caerostris darwini]|uniref:Uncharacterized protein n=1 Tax=Caerostris darwini TaxID=1538125 RepID=A0AAV4PK59_9ARAC|nr:hypothetical protein CDAR_582671 [Caerostris darwini]